MSVAVLLISIYAFLNRQKLIEIATVFLLALGICILIAPLCTCMEKHGMRTTLAAAVSVLLFVFAVLLLTLMFVPYIVSQSLALIRQIVPLLHGLFRENEFLARFTDGIVRSASDDAISPAIGAATASIARGSVSFAMLAGRFGFALVLAFYLLRERRLMGAYALLCLPVNIRCFVVGALGGCRNALRSYLSGMLKTSAFIGAATYIGLMLLGVPNAFLLALYMGVFEILPYIGPVLAAIPILLSSMTIGLRCTIITLVLIILVQQLESSFVSPYFMAASTSVHPLLALISVFVLGTLFGFLGILLAIPLLVSLRSIYWSVCQMRRGYDTIAAD